MIASIFEQGLSRLAEAIGDLFGSKKGEDQVDEPETSGDEIGDDFAS